MDNGASSYRRYLDGDKEAFDQIIKEYWDCLVFFLNRILRDHPASEDIAMDVFADLIVDRHGYNFKVSLKTYLFMLGRSRALNHLKRKNRFVSVALEDAAELPSPSPLPEELLVRSQQRQALWNALDSLSPELREAVYLTYFEGLSGEEAARVMKKKRKQVYNLLYRGKQELRAILGSEENL